jgi:hypothetical protein
MGFRSNKLLEIFPMEQINQLIGCLGILNIFFKRSTIMSQKKYEIKSSCPKCGDTFLAVLTPEEIEKRFGKVANIELDCYECTLKYKTEMKTACPEWDKDSKLEQS